MKKHVYLILVFSVIVFYHGVAFPQTEIVISGAQAGFPVAVPELCDRTDAGAAAKKIPQTITKDLQISGLFKLLDPKTFIESPGSCKGPEGFAYSDWTVVGAEGLVRGEVRELSDKKLQVDLYLFDVLQQKPVIARRYTGGEEDASMMAHRFTNEILLYFTGERGVFGTRVAYVGAVGRFKELFVVDLDGSNNTQLTNERGLIFSPSWSKDGQELVYTSYQTRVPDLYILPSTGGRSRRITSRPGLEVGAKFTDPGNSLISSASYEGISKLVLFDLKGQVLKKITTGSSIDVSPSYSPDSSQIAFCSNRAGGPQIYTMDSDGSNIKRISYVDSRYCTSPAWSPKGDRIAFVCARGGFQIFMSDTEGGNAVQLTFSGDNEDPSWSPDGRFLVFSSTNLGGGSKQLGVLSLLGGRPTRIDGTVPDSRQPSWSPMVD
jgi:TolB protein